MRWLVPPGTGRVIVAVFSDPAPVSEAPAPVSRIVHAPISVAVARSVEEARWHHGQTVENTRGGRVVSRDGQRQPAEVAVLR